AGTVSVLLGNGDGTFGPKTDFLASGNRAGSVPFRVAIADLNADGRPDLVVANAGRNPGSPTTVSVLLGNGDGTFGPETDLTTGINSHSVAIADLNADGRPDLAVANFGYCGLYSVSVLLGNGDGTFGPRTEFAAGCCPHSVAIGDRNGDGRPDLAVANGQHDRAAVLTIRGLPR